MKRAWDKLMWATEESSVDALRAKVAYHNGVMNLLLTSAGKYDYLVLENPHQMPKTDLGISSSLERIENQSRKMASNIQGIQDLLADSPETPIVSVVNETVFQISLSQAFMKEAERVRP